MWDFAGVAVLKFSGEVELEIVNPTLLPHDRPYPFRLFHFSIFERTAMPQNDGDYCNRSVSIAATSMFTAIIKLLSTPGFLKSFRKSTEDMKIYVVWSVLTIKYRLSKYNIYVKCWGKREWRRGRAKGFTNRSSKLGFGENEKG